MVDNNSDMEDELRDGYYALMMSYATGHLDHAQSLIVSAHLSLSHSAQRMMRALEMMGGAMLEKECEPVAMHSHALESVMNRLETREAQKTKKVNYGIFPDDLAVPDILLQSLSSQRRLPKWKMLYPGLHTFDIDLKCKTSMTRFLKADPSIGTPHHKHGGIEITLVLDGAFEDESGRYSKGDLIVSNEHLEHTPVACSSDGCVCMVVSTKPIQLTGLARLLNPFIRI